MRISDGTLHGVKVIALHVGLSGGPSAFTRSQIRDQQLGVEHLHSVMSKIDVGALEGGSKRRRTVQNADHR